MASSLAGADGAAPHAASVLAIPPVAVPKVRTAPVTARSLKGETTASDYVAPREIPAHTPRPTESVDAKVVIDVPEQGAGTAEGEAEVVEMRQRRRAPTMKIDRTQIGELRQIDGALERATEPDLPAMPGGPGGPPPNQGSRSAGNGSLRPASIGIEGHRPLARAKAEPRSARGLGWAIVALATVLVGGGVAAVALGLIPGLGPVPTPATEAVPAATPAAAPSAAPSAAVPDEAAVPEPAPTAAPTEVASTAPAASSAPSPSATPYRPPFQNGTGPLIKPQPLPRPRPKSDIPTGI